MKKPKLEDKILGKVYRMETGKTFSYIVSRAVAFSAVLLVAVFLGSVAFDIFREQGSFDLLNFWGDDIEVIKKYFLDNAWLFVEETPKELLLVLSAATAGLVYLIYKIASNFKKIKNKLVSIYKFYKNKR